MWRGAMGLWILYATLSCGTAAALAAEPPAAYRLATFSVDVTIPLGHRCMGILPQKAERIEDPLELRGFVLLGPDLPVVVAALDWCEIRNDSYDAWRQALAQAAETTPERVVVSALHQHDAPVVDDGAQTLLDQVGLAEELFDREFHQRCLERAAEALQQSLRQTRPVTHLGCGQARVEQIASNRRVVLDDGRVTFDRYSSSGGDPFHSRAPEGLIDPWLKTISFWDGETPLLALHAYATHPMSYYGRGGVSADFVGAARRLQQHEQPDVFQMYVSGCSGDVTAGKYNDGSPAMRGVLAGRLQKAMHEAWGTTQRYPLDDLEFRCAKLELPFHEGEAFRREPLTRVLHDPEAPTSERILAAMGLSSLDRVERGHPIDVPCVDFGPAQLVLLPGEAFVGYQLMAQKLRPDKFVLCVGYGECWPGYVPTDAAFEEGFNHDWRWAGPGSEPRVRAALVEAMGGED